jgi:hypothetical protein
MARSATLRLLLAVLGDKPADVISSALGEMSPCERDRIAECCDRLGVAPLVHRQLQATGLAERLSGDAARALAAACYRTAAVNFHLFRELSILLSALGAEAIPVIVLKGASMAWTVYESAALRPMRDVDLLVQGSDLGRVTDILRRLGYHFEEPFDTARIFALHHHLPRCFKPPATCIEVHWNIVHPDSPCAMDLDGIWARSREATVAGQNARFLSHEDTLIHLCEHVSSHLLQFHLLRSLFEIRVVCAKYANEIAWHRLIDLAGRCRAAPSIFLILALARKTLTAAVPDEVLQTLTPRLFEINVLEFAEEELLREDIPPTDVVGWNFVSLLAKRPFRARLLLLCCRTIPPRGEIAKFYGLPPGSPLLPLCYIYRLARREIAWAVLRVLAAYRRGPLAGSTPRHDSRKRGLEGRGSRC